MRTSDDTDTESESVGCIVIDIRRCGICDVIVIVWAQFAILIIEKVGVTPEQPEHAIRVHA